MIAVAAAMAAAVLGLTGVLAWCVVQIVNEARARATASTMLAHAEVDRDLALASEKEAEADLREAHAKIKRLSSALSAATAGAPNAITTSDPGVLVGELLSKPIAPATDPTSGHDHGDA